MGDWREEIIRYDLPNLKLLIHSPKGPLEYNLVGLEQNRLYRSYLCRGSWMSGYHHKANLSVPFYTMATNAIPATFPPRARQPVYAPVRDADSDGWTDVTINGTSSSGYNGAAIADYRWSWNGGSTNGATPVVSLPVGTTEVLLEVEDENGLTDTETARISVTPGSINGLRIDFEGFVQGVKTITLDTFGIQFQDAETPNISNEMLISGSDQGYSSTCLRTEGWNKEIEMRRLDGDPLDLTSFEHADGQWKDVNLVLTGYFHDGSMETRTLLSVKLTFLLEQVNWMGLDRVVFRWDEANGAIDNILFMDDGVGAWGRLPMPGKTRRQRLRAGTRRPILCSMVPAPPMPTDRSPTISGAGEVLRQRE